MSLVLTVVHYADRELSVPEHSGGISYFTVLPQKLPAHSGLNWVGVVDSAAYFV